MRIILNWGQGMRATFVLAGIFAGIVSAASAETPSYPITINKEHKFEPQEITIPADTKVKLVVKNASTEAVEFESHDFNREKVIAAGKEGIVFVGPLKAGEYGAFEEFYGDKFKVKVQ